MHYIKCAFNAECQSSAYFTGIRSKLCLLHWATVLVCIQSCKETANTKLVTQ